MIKCVLYANKPQVRFVCLRVRVMCACILSAQAPQSKKDTTEPNFMGLIEHLAATNEKAFGMTLFLVKAKTLPITPDNTFQKIFHSPQSIPYLFVSIDGLIILDYNLEHPQALRNVNTKRGLCRAWLRRLLNENSICFNLQVPISFFLKLVRTIKLMVALIEFHF